MNKWAVLTVVGLGTFLSVLDSSAVNVSLPTISSDLGADTTTIQWVVMGYLLTITGLLLTFGRLGDVVGRKRVYVVGMAVFTISVALCGAVQDIGQLIGLRVIQGIGSAGVMAIGPALTASAFPREERGKALGINATLVALGGISGPILGGALTDLLDWRWVFVVRAPFGLLATLLAVWILRDATLPAPAHAPATAAGSVMRAAASGDVPPSASARRSFDLLGAGLLFASLAALTLGLNQGRNLGWSSPATLALIGGAAIGLPLFVAIERRTKDPMLDLRVFSNRAFAAASASSLLSFMASFAVTFLMPFYLVQVLGYPAGLAGLALIPQPIVMSIVAPLSGMLSDRIGSRLLCTVGIGLTSLSLLGLSTLQLDSSYPQIAVWLMLLGVGLGLFNSPNSSALISSVSHSQMGTASGMMATMRNLGMVLGTAVAGAVWTGRAAFHATALAGVGVSGALATAQSQLGGFQDALVVSAAIAAIGIFTSLVRGPKTVRSGG